MDRISSQISSGGQLSEVDYAKEVASTHVDGTKPGPAEPPAVAPMATHEMAVLVSPQRSTPFEGPQASRPIGLPPDVVTVGSALRRAKSFSPTNLSGHLKESMDRRNSMFAIVGNLHSLMESVYGKLNPNA